MKRLIKQQQGMTLIELLIALLIAAIIMVAASYSILQVVNMNTRNTNYMTAVRHAQTAGYWVTRDVVMAAADNITVSDTQLTLNWRSDPDTWHQTSYEIINGILWRTNEGVTTRIAEHIATGKFSPITSPGTNLDTVTFEVTATVTSRGISGTETRVYEASPRPRLAN
jgi:prepilin-type N-terminal cleavage/methylation domain-containing protein